MSPTLPHRHLQAWRNTVVPVLALLFLPSAIALAQGPDVVGQWSSQMTLPCNRNTWVPTHVMLLPTGKVFYFSSYNDGAIARFWDPATQAVTLAAAPGYNLFCAGHSGLADGSLLITGGHIADYVGYPRASIYNPFTNTWTRMPDMNAGRWYPTNTTLANGDVLVVSGTTTSSGTFNNLPQVFQAATGTWRNLTSAVLHQPLYPFMYLAPNGKVFAAGPNATTRYLDTSGTGLWSTVGTSNFGTRNYGSSVMYDAGKVMIVGGGGQTAGTLPTATAEIIDLNTATPAWRSAASMHFPRRQNNATVLPDGKILVTGGTSSGGSFDDGTLAVHQAEIWDPATNTWAVMSGNAVYRGYHSFALLLPDGRVFTGGGQKAGCTAEIFSPPYLFKGARPTISAAPASVGYGQTAFIQTPDVDGISKVSWVRLGAVTHSYDQNQRFLPLSFTKVSGGLNVAFPASANLSPPGYYMLFILNGSGVPSVAKIIQISGSVPPSGSGAIAGKVTNVSTGGAVSGATVSYSGGSATSDAGGNYRLSNVAVGTYNVTAARTGYLSRTLGASVTSGNTTTLNFAIATAGILAGKVSNTAGVAVAGATVKITGGKIATTKTLTTNSTGSYSSSWIAVGDYSITVSASGLATQTKSATVNTGQTTTVDFTLQ